MATFGYGAALTGLAGAMLVPITGAAPTMGVFFVGKAFITVIVGGHLPLDRDAGRVRPVRRDRRRRVLPWSSVVGEVSVLVVAVILLRMLPLGITGRIRSGL